MDANSAPKKTFRTVQKRVVEDVKMSNESASGLGFHNLPFLVHRKSVKKGFEFTLMVVGELFNAFLLRKLCMGICLPHYTAVFVPGLIAVQMAAHPFEKSSKF